MSKEARLAKLKGYVVDKKQGTIYCFANPVKDGSELLGCSLTDDGRSCGYAVIKTEEDVVKKFPIYEEVFDYADVSMDRFYYAKYPDGFVFEFVSLKDIKDESHKLFQKALAKNNVRKEIAEIELEIRKAKLPFTDYSKKRNDKL